MTVRATITVVRASVDSTYVALSASTTHIQAEAEAIAVPFSKNRWLTETTTLSDVQFSLIEKGLESSVTMSEQASIEAQVKQLETMLLVETFSRAVQFNRSVTDIFTLDDAAQIDKDFYGNKGNVAFVSDVIGLTPEKVVSDSFTFNDVATIAMDWLRNLNNDFSVSDSITGSVTKIVNNAISLIESTDLDYSKGLSDSAIVDDQETLSLIKNLADSISLDDFAQIDKDFEGYKTNVFGFSEIVASGISKGLVNSIALVEVVGLVMSLGESDSVTVDDSSSVEFNTPSTDDFSLSDVSVSSFAKALSDTISLDDFAQINKDFEGNKGNVFGFSDVQSLYSEKGFASSLTMDDTVGNSVDKPTGDSISFAESFVSSFLNSQSDDLSTSDVNYMTIVKNFIDTISLDDTAQVNKDVDSTKGNAFGFSEVQTFGTVKVETDSLSLIEELWNQVTKGEEDSVSFSEVLSRVTEKAETDSFSTSDNSYYAITKRLEDAFTLDDDFQSDENVYRNKANIFSFDDVYSFTQGKVEYDSISFSEAIDVLLESILKLYDDISFADTSSLDIVQSTNDSVSIDDSIDREFDKALADSFTLDDSTQVDKDYFGNKGNVFGFSEVYDFATIKNLANSVSFTETTSTGIEQKTTDSVSFTDAYNQFLNKTESSSFVFTDDNSQEFTKTLTDTFALDDVAQIDKNIESTKGNAFSFSESITQSTSYRRAVTESYTLVDEHGVQLDKNLITDFGVTDQITVVHVSGSRALNLSALNTNTFN